MAVVTHYNVSIKIVSDMDYDCWLTRCYDCKAEKDRELSKLCLLLQELVNCGAINDYNYFIEERKIDYGRKEP